MLRNHVTLELHHVNFSNYKYLSQMSQIKWRRVRITRKGALSLVMILHYKICLIYTSLKILPQIFSKIKFLARYIGNLSFVWPDAFRATKQQNIIDLNGSKAFLQTWMGSFLMLFLILMQLLLAENLYNIGKLGHQTIYANTNSRI